MAEGSYTELFTGSNTSLMLSIQNGYSHVAEFLIECNANVNSRNAYQSSPLQMSVRENNLQIVSQLISANADLRENNYLGSILNYAIYYNSPIEIINLLIRQVNLSATNPYGDSALHLAAVNDDYNKIIKILLEQGMDINAVNHAGNTPLMIACGASFFIWGYICLNNARLLLGAGAKINISNKNGYTAFHYTARLVEGYEILELIIQIVKDAGENVGEYLNTTSLSGETILSVAALNSNADTVALLIGHGAKVNAASHDNGKTPLIIAVISNNVEFVKSIIKHGADVNAKCLHADVTGMTALMLALEEGYVDIANILIDAHADINLKNSNNMTAISFAAKKGYYEIVQRLMALQADVNVIDRFCNTPLMEAAANGHISIVSALIKANGHINHQIPYTSSFTSYPLFMLL